MSIINHQATEKPTQRNICAEIRNAFYLTAGSIEVIRLLAWRVNRLCICWFFEMCICYISLFFGRLDLNVPHKISWRSNVSVLRSVFMLFFELGIRWIWTLPLYLVTLYARKLNRCNNSRKRGRDLKWVFFLFSHAERKKLHAEKSNSERFFYCHKFQVTRILCHNVDIIHTQYVVESNETFPFLSFGFWNACETANCQESSRCRRKT